MKFDGRHKVKIESLTVPEASVFIPFLEGEIARHQKAIKIASRRIKVFITLNSPSVIPSVEFQQTAIMRHHDDIEQAKELIKRVKETYRL